MYKILYVDDEPDLLELGRIYLESWEDFTVDTRTSVSDSLPLLGDMQYDAIISDYQMPGTDGLEFLKKVRADYGDLPFILFTGRGREEVIIEAIDNGVDFYVQKGGEPQAQFRELAHKTRKALERWRAMDAQKKAHEIIHALLNTPPEVSLLIDTNGKILGLNTAATIRFGKSEEELVGSDAYNLFSTGLAQFRRENVQEAIRAKKPLVFYDGRTGRMYENHIFPIISPEGEVRSVAIYSRDTTEAQQSQNELRSAYDQLAAAQEELRSRYDELRQNRDNLKESEEKYRILVEHTQDGVFIAQDGRLAFVNGSLAQIIGYTEEDLAGRPITDVIAPDDRERVLTRHRGRIRGKFLPETYEFSLLHKDNNTRIRVRMNVGTGTYLGGPSTIGTVHDLTAERAREEELRESERRFRKIADATVEGLLMHREGIIQEVNASACALSGYTRQELIGKDIMDLFAPESRELVTERRLSRSEEPYEAFAERKDGSRFLGEMRSQNIIYHKVAIRLTSIRDITAQRQAGNSLREINKKLHLLSGITRHDIKNKLTSLLALLDLARNASDNRKMREYIDRLISITETIDNQVEFTRDYQELGILQPAWANVHELVRTAAAGVDRGKIRLINTRDNLEIFADPLIEKVFYNLLDNAVNYGDTLTRVTIHSEEMPDGFRIIVEDDGIGIKDKEKDRIFERGFGMNTGFGLFLTREILAITGMTIRETGIHTQGARFEISVPKAACRVKSARKKPGKKKP
jgi:PAS domain S-box-containing protein